MIPSIDLEKLSARDAAALEAMPEEARLAALGAMNDAAIRNLTAGLGAGLSQSPLSASLIGPITTTV